MDDSTGLRERYAAVKDELGQVCESAERLPDEVTLVAVSKTVGINDVAVAIAAGAHDFGENRPDQLMEKADCFPSENWHFIGNIQSRRIRDIVGRACLIHSLYQENHANKINDVAEEQDIIQDVLLEVNVSGEESKSGLEPAAVLPMLRLCSELPHIRVRGLMTMAPQGDPIVARNTFAELAQLRDEMKACLPIEQAQYFTELSMGMSEDWREAVHEGATIVRIGRAIFSPSF